MKLRSPAYKGNVIFNGIAQVLAIVTSKFFRVVAPEKYRQYLRLEMKNTPIIQVKKRLKVFEEGVWGRNFL